MGRHSAWKGAKAAGRAIASTATRWAGKAKQFATTAVSGAYRTVKGAASTAWNTAKSLGTKAFTGAKRAATAGWNTAKRLGTKVFSTAKALGGKVLGKAKALGSKIANTAQAAGRKLLGVADKLTGGAASKVAGAAKKVLGKAAGLLSWVVSTAKSLASKAINTAKNLGAKALSTAKSAASKAWQTAKRGASKGLATAKSLGTKAFNTAKSLGTKAWNTAKQLGSKAVSTAKSWAGKAWSTAKSWGGKAWGAIKSGAGKAWNATKSAAGKVWGAAKDLGRGALKVAKAVGLDKAWNTAKSWGGKAIGVVKQAAGALKKRFQPVLDVVGKGAELLSKAAPAILSAPAFLACKVLGCATPKLVNKGSQTSKEATDFATDVIPGVSTVKDACRCLTGENIVTGKEEGLGGRIMGCIWAAVDVASVIVGIFTAGTGTVAIQAIKTAAKAGLKALVKAGLKGFKAMVKAAIDLVKRAWKKIVGKSEKTLPRGVRATARTADGHTIKVTDQGKLVICSSCAELELKYAKELSSHADLKADLERIKKLDPEQQATAAAELQKRLEWARSTGHVPPAHVQSDGGRRFKDHYLRHRKLVEDLLGKKYPKWKGDQGAEFTRDLTSLINSGRLALVGRGTLAKGEPWAWIYRGEGLSLVLRQDGSFWTLLESGKGMDLAIEMIR